MDERRGFSSQLAPKVGVEGRRWGLKLAPKVRVEETEERSFKLTPNVRVEGRSGVGP